MSQNPPWERLQLPHITLHRVGWMSPEQQQDFEQWLGAKPDRVASGDPGKRSGGGEPRAALIELI